MPYSNSDSAPVLRSDTRRRLWLLSVLALLSLLMPLAPARPAAAEPAGWAALAHTAFKHIPDRDAAAGGQCFAQDRSGFLWIGTQAGLVRWDGYRSRKFVASATRDDALADNYIVSLLVDSRNRLWAGSSSGGLVRYDAERENFVRYPAGPAGLSSGRVIALADDGADGVWVGTGGGLDHLDAAGVITRRGGKPFALAAGSLPGGAVHALLRENNGRLWLGTPAGLFKLERGQRAPVAVPLAGKDGLAVDALFQDGAGRLWIGTRANGAFVIAPGADAPVAVRESGARQALQTERVMTITEAGQGEIWLGTIGTDGGIVAIDPLGRSRRIRHQADMPDSLSDNDILGLFRERGGIVYVGTVTALSQHDPLPAAVTTIHDAGTGPSPSVMSMLSHPNGRLWLGLASGGVGIIDPRLGALGHLKPAAGAPDAPPKGSVLAMAPGPDGTVYLGTLQGLYRADADGRRVRRVDVPGRRPDAQVRALALVDGVLWVGGLDGVWALSGADQPHPVLLRHEGERLGEPRVAALLAVDGALWVGTRAGLARIDLRGGAIEVVPTSLAELDRLPPGNVSSMLVDRRGRLWLSHFGTGIVILERTDADGRRRFRRLGAAEGLEDSGVNKLLQGADGAVWGSTDTGLARVDPATLAIHMFDAADGVHIPTYWANSGAATAAGELAFGGVTGVTVLRPEALRPWHYLPPVVVTRISLNDKDIPAGRYNGGAARRAAPIEVTPAGRERGFSLEFAALDYSASDRNRYAYRLAGFDADWIPVDTASRRVSYTNLPPGDYVLQLRGSNRNGDWSAPLEVPVRALPAWHQRPAARVAGALLALTLLAGLVHVRTAFLRRRQRELQAMVDARTAELRATQAQLEQMAYGDTLTGLPNRRLFNDELLRLTAQVGRGGKGFTLLLIDLDHFKQINDTLGHDAGDALLVAAAARQRAAVRESDRPFRLGGDEFAVLLSQTTERETLGPVCSRILEHLVQPLSHGGAAMHVSASVGAAIHDGPGGTHEQLYKRADVALYQAKAAGRNTWRLAGEA